MKRGDFTVVCLIEFAVDHFLSKGYKRSELYGTTWGDAGVTPIGLVDMKCSYVKQVR